MLCFLAKCQGYWYWSLAVKLDKFLVKAEYYVDCVNITWNIRVSLNYPLRTRSCHFIEVLVRSVWSFKSNFSSEKYRRVIGLCVLILAQSLPMSQGHILFNRDSTSIAPRKDPGIFFKAWKFISWSCNEFTLHPVKKMKLNPAVHFLLYLPPLKLANLTGKVSIINNEKSNFSIHIIIILN